MRNEGCYLTPEQVVYPPQTIAQLVVYSKFALYNGMQFRSSYLKRWIGRYPGHLFSKLSKLESLLGWCISQLFGQPKVFTPNHHNCDNFAAITCLRQHTMCLEVENPPIQPHQLTQTIRLPCTIWCNNDCNDEDVACLCGVGNEMVD